MKEKVSLEFERFRDSDGNSTCAYNFHTGEVCEFYRTQRFGSNETCLFAPESYKGIGETLDRRGEDKLGTLIPGEWCPLWKKEK